MKPTFSDYSYGEFSRDLCPIYVGFDNCFITLLHILGIDVIIPSQWRSEHLNAITYNV